MGLHSETSAEETFSANNVLAYNETNFGAAIGKDRVSFDPDRSEHVH